MTGRGHNGPAFGVLLPYDRQKSPPKINQPLLKGRFMFRLIATLMLAVGFTSAATTADARWSEGEDLKFVADTLVENNGQTVALCQLVEYMDILFIPVYMVPKSYALSEDGCVGDAYAPLTSAQFAGLQASGTVPADLPAEPALGLGMLAWGHAWLILGAIGILKTVLIAMFGKKRRKAGAPDMLAIHSLVAMSQVAVADGRIDDREVQQIANILTRLTGNGYADAHWCGSVPLCIGPYFSPFELFANCLENLDFQHPQTLGRIRSHRQLEAGLIP